MKFTKKELKRIRQLIEEAATIEKPVEKDWSLYTKVVALLRSFSS
jgi:hypothetical protein